MGGKNATPASEAEEAKEEPPAAQAAPARDVRHHFLNRMGFGQASAAYQGMSIRDFKVPKWMEGYHKQQEERVKHEQEEHVSTEVSERIAANDTYSLSFIQPRSNDDIRRGFLQKMTNAGLWLPPSQRQPKSQSIIIFDWDDTLLCTSYLNSREDAMNIQNKSTLEQLAVLEHSVCRLLRSALTLGNTYVITNAMKGWVEYSSNLWIPGVLEILSEITVISARSEYESKFPGNYHQWKVEAFLEMTKLFDTGTVTNLICLGDSNIEIDAAHTLAK